MKFVIYGAGGVGGVIGGLLYAAGFPVTLVARGEHARVLAAQGLRLVTPDADQNLPVPVVEHPGQLTLDEQTVVFMCMKSQHMQSALYDLSLCPGARDVAVVCAQNGVANEAMALRFFARVYGCVVNLPASFLQAGEVIGYGAGVAGILDVGRVPEMPQRSDPLASRIADALCEAGFSARADAQVMRWKYAKLLLNLLNVLQACLQDYDQCIDVRRQVRAEALACFAAAGINCASRDEVKARATAAGEPVMTTVSIPGFARTAGSSWQSLARGTGDIETEYLNGEICLLGRRWGVPTPANDVCVDVARETIAQALGPNHLTTRELVARIAAQSP